MPRRTRPDDLRFQLHQATHLEADHLGLLVACDEQRGKPAEERHVADERKRLVLGLRSKPLRDRYHRVIRRKTRPSLDARLHADLPYKQLRGLLCAQLSAVQAAADPDVSSAGSLSDTCTALTGIREGSLGILCFSRRLTVLHQVQVHVGHLRWFHHHPADVGREEWSHAASLRTENTGLRGCIVMSAFHDTAQLVAEQNMLGTHNSSPFSV